MSDDEQNDDFDEDDMEMSDSSEPELDEVDQNDDADAEIVLGVDVEEEEEDMIYGPLRPLKIRDGDHIDIVIVPDEKRKTSNFINLSEFTEATGLRASQIERGSHVFTDVTGLTDPIRMAHKEFHDRRSPLVLERVIEVDGGTVYVEHWKVREMACTYKE
jgi:hypothetical protein